MLKMFLCILHVNYGLMFLCRVLASVNNVCSVKLYQRVSCVSDCLYVNVAFGFCEQMTVYIFVFFGQSIYGPPRRNT